MSNPEEKSPVTCLDNQPESFIGVRAIAEMTTITLGVMALAPLLESLMSHFSASAESRRQMISHNNNASHLGLSHLGRVLNQSVDTDSSQAPVQRSDTKRDTTLAVS